MSARREARNLDKPRARRNPTNRAQQQQHIAVHHITPIRIALTATAESRLRIDITTVFAVGHKTVSNYTSTTTATLRTTGRRRRRVFINHIGL